MRIGSKCRDQNSIFALKKKGYGYYPVIFNVLDISLLEFALLASLVVCFSSPFSLLSYLIEKNVKSL